MKGNPVDDLFWEKLSHRKLNPPPEAWNVLEQSLIGNKNKKPYIRMSIAASLLAICTLGLPLLDTGTDQIDQHFGK